MCMGFGCNAAGVTGCRIIDSPRERLLAILTNSFVPCNGKFPTLIALLTIFFSGTGAGDYSLGNWNDLCDHPAALCHVAERYAFFLYAGTSALP